MSGLTHDEALKGALQAAKIRLVMQLRRNGISDTHVLAAMEMTPRDLFVNDTFIDQSYEDRALPIACEQTISQPTIVALMTQELQIAPSHTVLEIGTGSGYQAAILARLARRVHTIERHRPLHELAQTRFDRLKLRNITPHLGDGQQGWGHTAPYDRIMVTAAAFGDAPLALLEQLDDHGLMVIPIEHRPGEQVLYRIHREAATFVKTPLCKVQFVPLLPDVAN